MNRSGTKVTIACVVTDGASELPEFHSRLDAAFQQIGASVSLLYVDNGSRDDTDRVLRQIADDDPRVAVLRLSRQFAYAGALAAALTHTSADATIILQAKQGQLTFIPALIERWRQGYDLVWAMPRNDAKPDGVIFRFSRALSRRIKLPELEALQAFLVSKRVVAIYRNLPHRDEDVALTLLSYGFPQTTVTADADRPMAGSELLRSLGVKLIDNSILPIRIVSGFGIFLGLFALLYTTLIVGRWLFFGLGELGWPSLAVTLLFLGSVQMISLGIIVEYIWRIFQQTRQTPRYIIKEQLGTPQRPRDPAWTLDPNDLDASAFVNPVRKEAGATFSKERASA